jgi:hypothetical protein
VPSDSPAPEVHGLIVLGEKGEGMGRHQRGPPLGQAEANIEGGKFQEIDVHGLFVLEGRARHQRGPPLGQAEANTGGGKFQDIALYVVLNAPSGLYRKEWQGIRGTIIGTSGSGGTSSCNQGNRSWPASG